MCDASANPAGVFFGVALWYFRDIPFNELRFSVKCSLVSLMADCLADLL